MTLEMGNFYLLSILHIKQSQYEKTKNGSGGISNDYGFDLVSSLGSSSIKEKD